MVRACINFMTLCSAASEMSFSSPSSVRLLFQTLDLNYGFILGACLHLNVHMVHPTKLLWRHTFEECL